MLSNQFTKRSSNKNDKVHNEDKSLTVTLVMAHLNLEVQIRLLCELLTSTSTPLILLNRKITAPRYVIRMSLFQRKGFYIPSTYEIRDKDSQSITQLLDIMKLFDWRHIAIVFLNSTSKHTRTYLTLSNKFKARLIRKKYCFVYHKVNVDNPAQLSAGVAQLKRDHALKVVFLFGTPWREVGLSFCC